MDAASDVDLEAQLEALAAIEDLKKERDEMVAQRQANGPAATLASRKAHEANKKNLKSDLKKTTAFVKKIRSINTEGLQQCIRDVESLNLTLYISEIVGAIVETAYKATDVPSMVKLCVSLHRRYEEFTTPLLTGLKTALLSAPAEDDKVRPAPRRPHIEQPPHPLPSPLWARPPLTASLLSPLIRSLASPVHSGRGQAQAHPDPFRR